jgi:glycosyltransferase involved in cell wall biosynthesis
MSNTEIRPRIGVEIDTDFSRRFLLICFFDPNGIATVWENIAILQRYSRYKFEILNLWPGRGGYLAIPATVNLSDYAGVMIHPTAAYNPDNLFNLDSLLELNFSQYDGIKILAKQDEHYRSAAFPSFVDSNQFDILMSCIPLDEITKVYGEDILSRVSVLNTLTGYVSEKIRHIPSLPYEERRIDIAYRGSLQPVSFGRLGYEKWQIGAQVLAHPSSSRLALDISSRWEDRLSGIDWLAFLGRSRAVLGVESGSNLFDFDGKIASACDELARARPEMDPFSEEFYRLAEQTILHSHEDNVRYAQISPRHFEAAGARALQIMFEGVYSSIFEPGKHFFPLKRDMSNFEEAIDLVRDPIRAQRMIDAAYEDVILNDAYTYQAFVQALDTRIAERIELKGLAAQRANKTSSKAKPKALVMCAHDPVVDPRIGWWAASFKGDYTVCELGTYRFSEKGDAPRVTHVDDGHSRVQVERTLHGSPWKSSNAENVLKLAGVRDIALIEIFAKSSDAELRRAIGALDADEVDFYRFKELCRYFVNTNSALLQASLNMGRFDVIVCADLESLPAAIALKGLWNCHVVFDSHEYWPFSYTDFRAWENEFWSQLEARLAASADRCVTVSDTLAAHLTSEYGLPFYSVPNATPLADAQAQLETSCLDRARAKGRRPEHHDKVVFLFQGNFAPGRGLDLLVEAWRDVPEDAVLYLRGPSNAYRDTIESLARENGTLNRSVYLPDPVLEGELIAFARAADVGLIPYDSRHYGNRFACPNKLSQYMAAGIPILSNTIEYVEQIVVGEQIGDVVPFHDQKRLIAAVARWTSDKGLRDASGLRARHFFETQFNWDSVSERIRADIDTVVGSAVPDVRPIHFGWAETDRSMMRDTCATADSIEPCQDELLSCEAGGLPLLDETAEQPVGTAAVPAESRPQRSALRHVWRLLPPPVRYWVADQLRRLVR